MGKKLYLYKTAMTMSKKGANITQRQKEILTDFIYSRPDMQIGRFTESYTKEKSRELWHELTYLLNGVPDAPVKEWWQWRKCWFDLKKHTRNKIIREQIRMGATCSQDNEEEEKVVEISDPDGIIKFLISDNNFDDDTIKSDEHDKNSESENEIDYTSVDHSSDTVTEQLYETSQPTVRKNTKQKEKLPAVNQEQLYIKQDYYEKKLNMKQNYYGKKLALMEKDINNRNRHMEKDIIIKGNILKELKDLKEVLLSRF